MMQTQYERLETVPVQPIVSRLTFTGVDSSTELSVIRSLPPEIEIGVLYTWSPEGRHRYPDYGNVLRILKFLEGRKLSLHICGGMARSQLKRGILDDITARVQRIQVNGVIRPDEVVEICNLYPQHQIITQHTDRNERLVAVDAENHALLVDGSGGRGMSPEQWDRPDTCKPVGFAGGLGPNNILVEIQRISSVATGNWWVDMEGKLRDKNDWFDLTKAMAVVAALCG